MSIHFEAFGHAYPGAEGPALAEVTAEAPAGALTLVTGPSGAGKSTLLRAVNGLVPHFSGGSVRGRVRVGGYDPVALGPGVMSGLVGLVAGDPERASVMDGVADEVAFALENRGLDRETMHRRVSGALDRLGLGGFAERPLATLSGGERQRVQVAAALALAPRYLVLDEPTSQLDDDSARAVLAAVAELAESGDLTVLLSEHRLDRVLALARWQIHLPAAGLAPRVGPPSAVLPHLARPAAPTPPPITPGPTRLEVEDLWFSYDRRPILAGVSLAVRAGEVVALMGPSGSGKTTLLRLLAGLATPSRGRIRIDGVSNAGRAAAEICRSLGYLPQDPDALLFADTVRAELLVTLANHRLAAGRDHDVEALIARLGLTDLAERYPRDLSTGQRQRVALGAVTITSPGVLALDEPTRGLDDAAIAGLASLLHDAAGAGAAVLVATHDRRLARAAHRLLRLAG